MAVFGFGYNFGSNVPLVAFCLATVITLLIVFLRKPAADGKKRYDMAQILTYEIAMFFMFFVVVTLVNEPLVSQDIQLGEPSF